MDEISEGYSLENHVEGESRHLDGPLLLLELSNEIEELRRGEPWRANGQNAKTLLKYSDLRVVLIALKQGASLERHVTKGRISIQTISGHVRLKVRQEEVDLPTGCLIALEHSLPHTVEALEQSAILLTVAWPMAPD